MHDQNGKMLRWNKPAGPARESLASGRGRANPRRLPLTEALESRRLLSASISGTVFNDVNANGVRDSGEPALAGVRVYVDLNNLGYYKTGDPNQITSASGAYTISGLSAGTYLVRQVLPAQFRQTLPGNGLAQHVTVPGSTSKLSGCNFGDTQTVRVSGFVYDDANSNGAQDGGEGFLAGVTVYLDKNADGKLDDGEASTTTNSFGYFVIGDLPAGSYTVRVQPQGAYAGYVQTQPAGNGGYAVKLQKGQTADNLLFGIAKPTSSTVVLLSESRSVSYKGALDIGIGPVGITDYAKTQTASGVSSFNGNVSFSADSGIIPDPTSPSGVNEILVGAGATMSSSLSTTQITASGKIESYEYDQGTAYTSFADASMSFTVTFKVTKAVSYQLSATIVPNTNGLSDPDSVGGTFAFTAASGTSPVGTISSKGQSSPINLSKSGVLAAGTYTISETVVADDSHDIGPSVPYTLDLKFT
jgi:hypothetical protein